MYVHLLWPYFITGVVFVQHLLHFHRIMPLKLQSLHCKNIVQYKLAKLHLHCIALKNVHCPVLPLSIHRVVSDWHFTGLPVCCSLVSSLNIHLASVFVSWALDSLCLLLIFLSVCISTYTKISLFFQATTVQSGCLTSTQNCLSSERWCSSQRIWTKWRDL
jgi:hypothetical protein